jgi:hypothetical protein
MDLHSGDVLTEEILIRPPQTGKHLSRWAARLTGERGEQWSGSFNEAAKTAMPRFAWRWLQRRQFVSGALTIDTLHACPLRIG